MTVAPALAGCVFLLLAGCSSLGVTAPGGSAAPGRGAPKPGPGDTAACRALSKADLDHVIDARLDRRDAAAFLHGIAVKDYEIVDPGTNWMHGGVPGASSSYAVYYFTYRQRYFILFLRDRNDGCADALDALVIPRTSADYDLGMGPTQVDTGRVAEDVIVIYNRKGDGNHSDDILAAWRPNLDLLRFEAYPRDNLRVFREE